MVLNMETIYLHTKEHYVLSVIEKKLLCKHSLAL